MRTGRIVMEGQGYYHVISHLVAGTPRMGYREKEQLRRLMRAYETFCGVRVLTYAILGTHFHLLLDIPERQEVTEGEVVRRMAAIYSPAQVRERQAQWSTWRKLGHEYLVQQDLNSLRERMYDLSQFMKVLKQRFSQWYNRTTSRRGTLWEDRFKSIVVEGTDHVLTIIAAYIDLNAVRAGLASDPKDYRWSGYGEALGGNRQARAGLQNLMGNVLWDEVQRKYRVHLYDKGEKSGLSETGEPLRTGLRRENVEQVLCNGGRLSRTELLRCRVRYFTDGMALGSREFVNRIFRRYRDHFGPKRQEGARALRFGDWGGLYTARDLRLAPILASTFIAD